MASKDYYAILGVDRNATKEEISKAYRKAAMKYHPDRQQGKTEAERKEAEEKFKECSEAAEVLTDDQKRASYDRFGSEGPHGAGFEGMRMDPREFFRRFHGFGFDEDDMFGGFGFDPFGGFGRNENSQANDPNSPRDGADRSIGIRIDFAMSLYGGSSTFSVDLDERCEACNGTGAKDGHLKSCHVCGGSGMETERRGMMIMSQTCRCCHGSGTEPGEPCPECGGEGRKIRTREVTVRIPPGMGNGKKLVLRGEGYKGINGGKDGDLYVTVNVSGNSPYGRDGINLKTMLPLSPITATLGGKIKVETPWGTEDLEIPRGTRSGTVLKIQGHGVRTERGSGDLLLTAVVSCLTNLSPEQEKLLRKVEKGISDENVAMLDESNRIKREFRSARK